MKKSIKTKQEYLGVEKKKEKVANPLDRPLAIEGSKGPLAITGGETGEKEKQPGAVPNPVAKPNEHGALVPVTTEESFQHYQAHPLSKTDGPHSGSSKQFENSVEN